jgi:hypothetical protein
MEPPDAAVGRIGTPLDKTAPFQPIDEARDGDRFDFDQSRQFVLRYSRLRFQADEDFPLRKGHSEGTRPRICARANEARNVAEKKDRVAIEAHFHSAIYYNAAYDCKPFWRNHQLETPHLSATT